MLKAFRSVMLDTRGLAAIEAALVLPIFLSMFLAILSIGAYFILQSALDLGVLATGETLNTNMAAGSSYTAPTLAALKSSISSNGGAVLTVARLSVDVTQLSTLSASAVALTDGSLDWGGSGSVLIVRASATLKFIPMSTTLTMRSSTMIRRPSY